MLTEELQWLQIIQRNLENPISAQAEVSAPEYMPRSSAVRTMLPTSPDTQVHSLARFDSVDKFCWYILYPAQYIIMYQYILW